MTPPAATAAGRALPRTAAPRAPRRVSGPARPPRARQAPPRAPRAGAAGARRRSHAAEPLAVRALRAAQRLADSRLLARLIGGRLWIPVVAVGLIGIVFMQVTMLRLNAGISKSVEQASALQRDNAVLRADVSRLQSADRIDGAAAALGMVVPSDTGDHYVVADPHDAARAAIRMTAPDPAAVTRTEAAATTAASTATATTATTATAAAPTADATATAPTAAPTTSATGTTATATATATPTSAATEPAATTAAPAATTPATADTTAAAPVDTTVAQSSPATAVAAAGGTAAPTSGQG